MARAFGVFAAQYRPKDGGLAIAAALLPTLPLVLTWRKPVSGPWAIIRAMQTLRRLTNFARLVLAWFVLSLGVAVASPLVAPQDTVLVCTGAGVMKVLVKADDGSTTELGSATMDCPLCALVAPPPVFVQVQIPPVFPLAHALQPAPSAHIAARTAAPLPPRGPPNYS